MSQYKVNSQTRKYTKCHAIIIMALFTFVLVGCNSSKEETNIDGILPNYGYAVFEKNSNIYMYDRDDKYLNAIGDLTKLKELATISNDNRYIAFKYMDILDEINIYDLNTREYNSIRIEDSKGKYISNLSWKDNKLVVELYINPTTTQNLIYNVEDGNVINSCQGILIDILDEGNTIIYGKNINGYTSIYQGDSELFKLENKGEIILKGTVNEENNNMAFVTFLYNKESAVQEEYLYSGILKNNKLEKVHKVIKPYEIDGDILYNAKDIFAKGSGKVYKLKGDNFIQIESEENTLLEENTKRLKEILKNTFKSENITEDLSWQQLGISNITWFSK